MKSKFAIFIKLLCLAYLVVLVPWFISVNEKEKSSKQDSKKLGMWIGVEHLVKSSKDFSVFKEMNLCLVCSPSSVDQYGHRSIDVLLKNGFKVKQVVIFQDVLQNDLSDLNGYKTLVRKISKAPCSIFDNDFHFQIKENVDAVIIDIQDSGISGDSVSFPLLHVMQESEQNHKKVIVLDRPNLLGGRIEGAGDIPWRHGMTMGELAYYFNKHVLDRKVDLSVVPMMGWRRRAVEFEQGRSLLNILKETKPINVSFNSKDEPSVLLLPEKNSLSKWEMRYLKRICWRLGLHCKDYSKWNDKANKFLYGIKISVKNNNGTFSSFNSILTIVRFLNNRKNIEISFSEEFDKKLGSSDVRRFLQGGLRFDNLKNNIDQNVLTFYHKAKECLLYKPEIVVGTTEIVKG